MPEPCVPLGKPIRSLGTRDKSRDKSRDKLRDKLRDKPQDEPQGKRRVLFLCTGNSCRSQMAEAIVNSRLGEQWEAFSAGTKPAGYVHPKALDALAEIGIQHTGYSKLVDEFRGTDFDLVVTVCDNAAEECPIWLGKGKRVHHSYPDPAKTDDLNDFRRVRDDMEREIIYLFENFEN